MRTLSFDTRAGAMGAALLAALLSGCGKPVPVPDVPEPTVAPAPVESAPAPAASLVPVPEAAVADAAVSAPAAATARPASEPALSAMKSAQGSSKLSVPVDLRYQFDGPVQDGQPVTLHIAAVPRVEGSNLAVSIKEVPGVRTTSGELRAQKATAATAYRRQLAVTKLAGGPRELRVLVTMDMPLGSAFGWFSVPFDAMPTDEKRLVDKQQ
jgi:hypothetical protein